MWHAIAGVICLSRQRKKAVEDKLAEVADAGALTYALVFLFVLLVLSYDSGHFFFVAGQL